MKHSKILIGVAVLAILFILAGIVVAESLAGQQYSGCLSRYGFIYAVAIGDQSAYSCRRGDTKIGWNQAGEAGAAGHDGEDGSDGINCWDLNGSGVGDITTGADNEDLNNDGAVNALDCLGPQGPQGPQGVEGAAGIAWYEWVVKRYNSIGADSASVIAHCSQGSRPVGGGYAYTINEYQLEPPDCLTILEDRPEFQLGDRPGWLVKFDSDCPDLTLDVYTICSTLELEPPPPTPASITVFATSEQYNGDLGGIVGADQKCQDLALQAGLAGTYKAYLSDGVAAPADWVTYRNIPYELLDGTRIADDWTDLVDGTLQAPIDINEYGLPAMSVDENGTPYYDESARAWTAVALFGESNGFQCPGWTSSSSSDRGGWEKIHENHLAIFNDFRIDPCSEEHHLYCFEQ